MACGLRRRFAFYVVALLLCSRDGWAQQQKSQPDSDARRALESAAGDRFVVGDMAGALDALNEMDPPRIDQVKIEGLVRSNRRQINEYLGLKPGELLTAEKLERTRRRLEDLPTSSGGKIRFDPVGGRATVTPIVFERQAYPTDLMDLAAVGARAIFLQELRVDISDVLGWGEVWEPAFRWDRNRRRGLLRMAMPAPGAVPGVLGFEGFWEHQTYDSPSIASQPFRQTRMRAGAGLSDWVTSWLRLQSGLAVDHIDSDTHLELGGGVGTRAWDDRFAVTLYAGHWFPLNGGTPFNRGDVVMSVRSTAELHRPMVTALAGVALASPTAPLAVWPGASAGQGRGVQLRAHQLLRDGIVAGEVFGRTLLFTTVEYVHPIQTPIGPVGLAGFVDAAQARSRLDPSSASPFHVDVGMGVRMNTSRSGNAVRLDAGYGLRDGRIHVSAGYVIPWGER